MTSHKFDPKLTPPPPSVTFKLLFYLQLYTEGHTIEAPATLPLYL